METADEGALLRSARGGDREAFSALVEPHRRRLFEHAYRMLGSVPDADDLVQETLLRAWGGIGSFEERASMRTWLCRIATNACLSFLERRPRRTLPFAERPAHRPEEPFGPPVLDPIWIDPLPADPRASPEERVDARESVAFAFLVALQRLPPRQRAVLLLRDVLELSAADVADQLDESVAAVESTLHRARESVGTSPRRSVRLRDPAEGEVLAGYLKAWEATDLSSLLALLEADARLSMPPMPEWLEGRDDIGRSLGAMVFTPEARGALRAIETTVNGLPAAAVYRLDPADGRYRPMALHALSIRAGRIGEMVAFQRPELFARFGLPAAL